MWAHLQNWIVQDGEIPELYSGSTLQDHALRASCWSIRASTESEGVTELPGPDPSADSAPHYDLTGTVEWGQEPSSVLVRVGGFNVLVEPISVRQVPGTSHETYALERFSPDFLVPSRGTKVTVACRLEVMADYETDDAFGYPDLLRRDWVVRPEDPTPRAGTGPGARANLERRQGPSRGQHRADATVVRREGARPHQLSA